MSVRVQKIRVVGEDHFPNEQTIILDAVSFVGAWLRATGPKIVPRTDLKSLEIKVKVAPAADGQYYTQEIVSAIAHSLFEAIKKKKKELKDAPSFSAWWTVPENLRYFLASFHAATYGGTEHYEQDDPSMNAVIANTRMLLAWLGTEGGHEKAYEIWTKSVRDVVKRAITTYEALPSLEKSTLDDARKAYKAIVSALGKHYATADIEAERARGAGNIRAPVLATKEDIEESKKALEEFFKFQGEAVQKYGDLLAKDTAVQKGIFTLKEIYDLVNSGGDLADKLAKAKGTLAKIKTIDELLQFTLNTMKVTGTAICHAGAIAFPKAAAQFLQVAEYFENFVGRAVGLLQIIHSGLSLVKAIEKGDTRGIVHSSVGVATGAAALLAPELAGPIGVVAACYLQAYEIAGQLGGILAAIDRQVVMNAVKTMYGHAAVVADQARTLAAALEAWAKRRDDTSLDREVLEKEAEHLEKKILEWSGHIRNNLLVIRGDLVSTDKHSVGAYKDLVAAYEDGVADEASLKRYAWDPPEVIMEVGLFDQLPRFTQAVFAGLERVGKVAKKNYGK